MDDLHINTHDRFAGYVHDQTSKIIGTMDAKASILLGLASSITAFCIFELKAIDALGYLLSMIAKPQTPTLSEVLSASLVLSSLTGLGLSIFFGLRVIKPRRAQKRSTGIVYFEHILNAAGAADYSEAILSMNGERITASLLEDVYYLSIIARKKTRNFNLSFWFFALGISSLVIAVGVAS